MIFASESARFLGKIDFFDRIVTNFYIYFNCLIIIQQALIDTRKDETPSLG
jgi:hypothetical protein